jgi:uncharacterized membrane protein YhaH (DUF805 family)
MTALELFGWQGRVRRGVYALVGFLGLAIKHNLDRYIALQFREKWSLWSYWAPIGRLQALQTISAHDRQFLLALFLTAIPFIWIGLTLTVKRLRDAGQPTWLAILFFAPVVNLIFFAVLAIYPTAGEVEVARRRLQDFANLLVVPCGPNVAPMIEDVQIRAFPNADYAGSRIASVRPR